MARVPFPYGTWLMSVEAKYFLGKCCNPELANPLVIALCIAPVMLLYLCAIHQSILRTPSYIQSCRMVSATYGHVYL